MVPIWTNDTILNAGKYCQQNVTKPDFLDIHKTIDVKTKTFARFKQKTIKNG